MVHIDSQNSGTFPQSSPIAGRIARMFIYPVKSFAGIEVDSAALQATGLAWDRSWMLVDANGLFLSQRTLPRMALVQPRLEAGALLLAFGGNELRLPLAEGGVARTVRVWKDSVQAWDMGDEAARLLGAFLGQECRLVRFDSRERRLSSLKWTDGAEAPNQFADSHPVLVITQGALDGLNARLAAQGHAPVAMQRFRPNIVLDGLAPHAEDHLRCLQIGEVQLQLAKPCTRCPIPDIDPLTAFASPEVGRTLRSYRQDARVNGGVTFGRHAIVARGAGQVLRTGARVDTITHAPAAG